MSKALPTPSSFLKALLSGSAANFVEEQFLVGVEGPIRRPERGE
jgi:hypothetical protein